MLKFILFSLFITLIRSHSEYCDQDLCPNRQNHIGCGNSGEFNPTCPPDRQLVNLTRTDVQLFLNNHNKLRSRIANGDEVGFLPASRMATMVSGENIL
jgi:hypothetical protein